MIEWLYNNWVEITGASLAFVYLILEIQRKWFFWVIGIISSCFYVYIFHQAGLYAEMGLNGYYVIMCFYGLYCWRFQFAKNKAANDFNHIKTHLIYILLIVFIAMFFLLLLIIQHVPGSKVPVADVLIATLSIIATWMAAKKIVECWYIWIFVNIFATGLYIHQLLYPTAVLFTIYSVLSFVGLKEWKKSIISNDTTDSRL